MMRKTLCAAALCTATLAQATPLEITYTAVVTRSTGGSGLPALGDTLSGRVVFDDTEGAYSPCTSPMQPRPPMPWLGIEAELIELLRLAPPDPEPMLASLQRTGRLACAAEAGPATAAAAEMAAVASERAFALLRRPVVRIVVPAGDRPPLSHLTGPLVQLVAGPRVSGTGNLIGSR
jgi:hypothetical protein